MEATNSTITHDWRAAFLSGGIAANSTITSFTAPVRRLTRPHLTNTNASRYVRPTGDAGARGLSLMVGGTGSDDQTINFRIIAWTKVIVTEHRTEHGVQQTPVFEYIPKIFWAGTATLSTLTGIADGFGTSQRFADTITESTALSTSDDALTGCTVNIHSPTGNASEAKVRIEDVSHDYDGFTFETDVGTATDAQVYYSFIH